MAADNPTKYVPRPEMAPVFANQLRMLSWDGQLAQLELCAIVPENVGPNASVPTFVPVVKLVLTPQLALDIAEKLNALVGQLEKSGVLKRAAPGTDTRQ